MVDTRSRAARYPLRGKACPVRSGVWETGYRGLDATGATPPEGAGGVGGAECVGGGGAAKEESDFPLRRRVVGWATEFGDVPENRAGWKEDLSDCWAIQVCLTSTPR